MSKFEKAAKKQRKVIAAEIKVDGPYIIPAVGKRIIISFLGATKAGHREAVHAEIIKRKISIVDNNAKDQLIEPSEARKLAILCGMNWQPKILLIKIDELKILASQPGGASVGGKAMTVTDVKECVPQSEQLRQLLPEQNQWHAEKRKR